MTWHLLGWYRFDVWVWCGIVLLMWWFVSVVGVDLAVGCWF